MPTKTDSQLDTAAVAIKSETISNANTAVRVGSMLEDMNDSKINIDKIGVDVEATTNKNNDAALASNSTTEYPTVHAVKTFAEALVVGLLSDRGNYNASGNVFPTTGGRGGSGLPLKGDLWYISVGGTLGGTAVSIGYSIRALIDTPGQTAGNWGILNVGLGYTPENSANKSTNIGADTGSNTKYPSVAAVETAITAAVTPPAVPYTEYVALLTKGAFGAVSAVQLVNTVGDGTGVGAGDVVWTNPSNGTLLATMTTGSPFSVNTFFPGVVYDNGGSPYFVTCTRLSATMLLVMLYDHTGSSSSTPNFNNLAVSFKIYS